MDLDPNEYSQADRREVDPPIRVGTAVRPKRSVISDQHSGRQGQRER
jgi:hypothetical protein